MASLLKSSTIVSFWTMMSRILGLVRDVVLANLLGADGKSDIFLVAQKIPNFLRRLFAEGAFATAFVPVFSEYYEKRSKQETLELLSKVSGTLGGFLFVITIIGVLGSQGLMAIFGFGFYVNDPAKFYQASELLKITFPYIFFISLVAMYSSVLNTLNRFAIPAFAPILLNVSIIGMAWFAVPYFSEPVYALAWGIFIAGVAQLLLLIPFLWKEGYLTKPKWAWKDSAVRRIMKLMLPVIFGASVSQINLLIDTQIASLLNEGSISWLYYSDRMLEFPLGIFGIAIATVLLPTLSKYFAKEDMQHYSGTLDWGLRMVLMIGIPAAVGLLWLAEPIMITVFQHGAFTAEDSFKAGQSLQAYSLGLIAFMMVKVFLTGFYSRQDTKTPVKIGVISVVSNIVLNLALFKPFGHVGLAAATSIAAFINAILLYRYLHKHDHLKISKKSWIWIAKLIIATGVLLAGLWYFDFSIEQWQSWTRFEAIGMISAIIGATIVVYGVLLVLMGLRPRDFRISR
ncbi:MAG: murein biosynthesis integral membrane protein MurJ [Kangiellaceae bacterium]|nr:murein biosynthesis integral membrane protein MurJ [Kangiellaceae bacterium]